MTKKEWQALDDIWMDDEENVWSLIYINTYFEGNNKEKAFACLCKIMFLMIKFG